MADSDKFSSKETKQRFDAMLKGAMKSPPKPLKTIATKAKKRKTATRIKEMQRNAKG